MFIFLACRTIFCRFSPIGGSIYEMLSLLYEFPIYPAARHFFHQISLDYTLSWSGYGVSKRCIGFYFILPLLELLTDILPKNSPHRSTPTDCYIILYCLVRVPYIYVSVEYSSLYIFIFDDTGWTRYLRYSPQNQAS